MSSTTAGGNAFRSDLVVPSHMTGFLGFIMPDLAYRTPLTRGRGQSASDNGRSKGARPERGTTRLSAAAQGSVKPAMEGFRRFSTDTEMWSNASHSRIGWRTTRAESGAHANTRRSRSRTAGRHRCRANRGRQLRTDDRMDRAPRGKRAHSAVRLRLAPREPGAIRPALSAPLRKPDGITQ